MLDIDRKVKDYHEALLAGTANVLGDRDRRRDGVSRQLFVGNPEQFGWVSRKPVWLVFVLPHWLHLPGLAVGAGAGGFGGVHAVAGVFQYVSGSQSEPDRSPHSAGNAGFCLAKAHQFPVLVIDPHPFTLGGA